MTNFDIQRVIIYPRKSREDVEREKETGEDCLAAMTEMLCNTCKKRSIQYTENDIMPEIGSADTIDDRPVFKEILETYIPSGSYQGIVVREISRLGRGNFTDAGRIYDALIAYNFYVITPHKIYDPSNLADKRQIRMELFIAREEYENIKERLWEYRDAKAKKGFSGCRSNTLGLNSNRGKWSIIPEEVKIVLDVFQMRAKNISFPEIADVLNSRGVKTKYGGKFYAGTIYKIVTNKRYIGIHTWKGVEYPAKHPPIVPMDLWNKVHQEIQPQNTHAISSPRDNDYLVELYCHECGSRMYGWKQKRKNSEYIIYDCSGRRNGSECTHLKPGNKIHKTVLEELKKIILNPKILMSIISESDKSKSTNLMRIAQQIKDREKLLSQKEKFLLRLDADYEREDSPLLPEIYNRRYSETMTVINNLKNEILKLKREATGLNVKVESIDFVLKNLQLAIDNWDKLNNKRKKVLIKSFFPRIEISRNGTMYFDKNVPTSLE
ncbi:recombinase family protein [Phosphitispora fastidiosa]|uniref:recombinase family protein n=1 Tax=Phosphitispora fastidiosa TaxID=2837202 RepID=UPI001E438394|nr:recombinase family protein [Phosphitispora fastidiosa]MBU7006356.1 DNA invertase Pin-like site-specific DNA recombinase [Phosphitispora fastidiosa]